MQIIIARKNYLHSASKFSKLWYCDAQRHALVQDDIITSKFSSQISTPAKFTRLRRASAPGPNVVNHHGARARTSAIFRFSHGRRKFWKYDNVHVVMAMVIHDYHIKGDAWSTPLNSISIQSSSTQAKSHRQWHLHHRPSSSLSSSPSSCGRYHNFEIFESNFDAR